MNRNIDTRIQQAELQYKLGREELELLSLGEQARALAQLIEQADAAARAHHRATLYRLVILKYDPTLLICFLWSSRQNKRTTPRSFFHSFFSNPTTLTHTPFSSVARINSGIPPNDNEQ
jgi:hypothetical protein